jgi:hypothetical protein
VNPSARSTRSTGQDFSEPGLSIILVRPFPSSTNSTAEVADHPDAAGIVFECGILEPPRLAIRSLYIPRNTHWNEDGNRLASDVLFDYLIRNNFLPAPRKDPT